MADEVEQDDACAATGVAALVVCRVSVVKHVRSGLMNVLSTHGKIFAIAGKMPPAARNTPKYRTPTDLTVARRM